MENFKKYNKIKMSEEGLTALYEIPQVVNIINKCGLSSKTEIKKMLKMARRNDIGVDFF